MAVRSFAEQAIIRVVFRAINKADTTPAHTSAAWFQTTMAYCKANGKSRG